MTTHITKEGLLQVLDEMPARLREQILARAAELSAQESKPVSAWMNSQGDVVSNKRVQAIFDTPTTSEGFAAITAKYKDYTIPLYVASVSAQDASPKDVENARLREVLRVIAGGFSDKDSPSLELPPHEFRSAMWTWSQRKAREALEPPK